jgi:hypothetical protein
MFSLVLSKDHLRVDPGSAATLAVSIQNTGTSADRCELSLGGLDVEWVAIPVPAFTLAPGESRSEKILVKPPRSAESKSGAYPFTVSVRSLESGQGSEVPCVLEVEAFNLLSVEIEPKRGAAGYFKQQAHFDATIINLGNVDQNLQLFADDPEDGCTYQFGAERIQLAPGQQREVGLDVEPKNFPIVGGSRLFGFAVSARSVENPLLAANAQAQVERRALFAPAFLISLVAIIALATVWFAMRPKPATVDSFSTNAAEITLGDVVEFEWSTTNAKSVTLESADGSFKQQGLPPRGHFTLKDLSRTTTFMAYATNDLGMSRPGQVTITVKIPPPTPSAVIESFNVSPKSCSVGDTITVRYRVRDAVRISLQPLGIDLAVKGEDAHTFIADTPGTMALKLVAYNAKNEAVSRTLTITVADKSDARILVFRALLNGEPITEGQEVELGTTVTIEWQVTNAARIEVEPRIALSGDRGTVDVVVDKSIAYKLTALDSNGRAATARITLKAKTQPSPLPPP